MSAVPFLETVSVDTTSISFDAFNASGGVDRVAEIQIDVSGSQRIATLYADDGAGGIAYGFLNLQVGTPDLPLWMPYPMEATPAATSAVVLAYLSDEDPAADPNTLAYLSDFAFNGSKTTLAYLSDPIVRYNPATALPWAVLLWADGPAMASIADGTPVTTWVDETVNGRSPTQATSTARPVLHRNVAAWNGRSTVTFDGVDDNLKSATFTTAVSQQDTVVVIGKLGRLKGVQQNFVSGAVSSSQALAVNSAGAWLFNAGQSLVRGTADTGKHLFTASAAGASSTFSVDGTLVGAGGNAGTNALSVLRLGVDSTSPGGSFLTGDLAFVGVVPRALTAAELSDLRSWAQGFYGTP